MFRQIVSVFVENKLAVVGLVIIVFMVLFCFVGPLFYHTNQINAQDALRQLHPEHRPRRRAIPSAPTRSGFDILGRLMFGGKNSLIVGLRGRHRWPRCSAWSTAPCRGSSAAGSTPS